mmetsp:Transcript_69/g.156  ORF Transcript_69/g.156 Transcript_69/m.156 type:complete len:587 (-) Transcript_69:1268-3028(-)
MVLISGRRSSRGLVVRGLLEVGRARFGWSRKFSGVRGFGTVGGLDGLVVKDSLQNKFVPFQLERKDGEERDRLVTMYVCGPTVYDASHLGHARTYVHFDCIRRILEDALGYQVAFFMNVTDVDDKIINRAKQAGVDWLDLAKEQEDSFFKDMARIGVEPPTYTSRATEFVGEIVEHIEALVENNLAYVGQSGSVYFDISAYNKQTAAHPDVDGYGKLMNVGETEEDEEDTGMQNEKRHKRDFALWKSVNDEEEKNFCSWASPWGHGRPGWHAECSAMVDFTAGKVRGDGKLDIHGGGIDLKFPHHENELAQSQSLQNVCHGCSSSNVWTSFFLHTGHLHIRGRKMSKSLKNFVTVDELLGGKGSSEWPKMTPRQLRLLLLSTKYSAPMEISHESVEQAFQLDATFRDFFLSVKAFSQEDRGAKWEECDSDILKCLDSTRQSVDKDLKDDFNIPRAIVKLRELVSQTNKYMAKTDAKAGPVRSVAHYLTGILATFGIGALEAGWRASVPGYMMNTPGVTQGNQEARITVEESLDVLVQFREDIRNAAKGKDIGTLFKLCDQLRDHSLPEKGIILRDRGDMSQWSYKD